MIAIYLSKQQALDANPKSTQWINFTGNLDKDGLFLKNLKKLFCIFHKESWECCKFLLM